MSSISKTINKSPVKILSNILMTLAFIIPQLNSSYVFAAGTRSEIAAEIESLENELKSEKDRCNKISEKAVGNLEKVSGGSGDFALSCQRSISDLRSQIAALKKSLADGCKTATETLRKARADLAKKCGEAALGKECVAEAESCTEAAGEESYNSVGAFAEAAGFGQYSAALNTAMGSNKKSENGVCAKYSSKDYATERKEIQTDLEKVSDDLAKLIEEKAKMQKDFSKEMQDIQKKVNEAQEELEKQKLKIKENKRERLANFQNNQNQQKDQLRRINSSILGVKGEIITAERDKAMKLIALSDASGQRTCLSEYNKARANSPKASSSSTSNFVASSSAKKKDLIAIYTDCIAVFQQQRVALNESSKQKMDQLNASLSDLQAQSEELTGTMDLASNQLAEMEKDAATEQSQAEQKVIKLMQTSQQEMLTAQQELTSNLQALSQKEATLKTKQNRLSNSLMSMGPTPKSGAKATPESIASEAGTLAEDVKDAEKAYEELKCGKSTTSTSSGTKGNR